MEYFSEKYEAFVNKICAIFSTQGKQMCFYILYKIVVDLIYVLCVGKNSNFGICISWMDVIVGYIMVCVSFYWVKEYLRDGMASSYIMLILNMIYFIPLTTYCSYGLGSNGFYFFAIVFWLLLSVLYHKMPVVTIAWKNRGNNILKGAFYDKLYYVFFFIIAALVLFISFRYTHFRVITNLEHVYEIRAEAAAYDLPVWLIYIQNFLNIIIPLVILMAFKARKYLCVLGGIILLWLQFSFEARKSVLFMGVLLIFCCIFWRKQMIHLIIPGGFFLGIVALVENFCLNHGQIIDYLFRRQGYALAQLSDNYYRFFENNPTDIYRSYFLGKIGFESPYSLPIAKVIGNNYYEQSIVCNNGLLADVWANLGVIGIFIVPVILMICFRLFDFSCYGLDSRYYVALAVYSGQMFANTFWSIVLLTHGFLIMCIIFIFFPKDCQVECDKT